MEVGGPDDGELGSDGHDSDDGDDCDESAASERRTRHGLFLRRLRQLRTGSGGMLRRLLALGALGAARGACIGASSVGPCPAPPNASTLLWAFGAASTVSCACACASSQLCGWWTHDLANGTCRVQTARTADAADPAPGGASCASGPTARAATDDDRDDDSNASAAKPNILWVSHARAPRSPGRG